MISVRGIKKSFGDQVLYDGADLQLNAGDRFALVGPNGAGKSTLFKMLLGEEEPDGGSIEWKRGAKAGYLPQENPPIGEETVLETALAHRSDPDGRETAKAKKILMGLGFKVADFDKPISELSGGWAMRGALARLLVEEPQLLLLDEPTNHLDLLTLVWFQEYLQSYPGAILMISHDRGFIDEVCSAIVAVEDKRLKKYNTNYEGFLAEREAARDRVMSAYKQQQDEIAAMEDFIMRNRARVSTASRVQSVMKKLDKIERIELPPSLKSVSITFPQPGRTGTSVLRLKNVHKAYGSNVVYDGLNFELERGQKMAFVGPNGAGKSTLLKVLGDIIPIDSGERVLGHNVKVGYFSQHREGQLDPRRTVLQEATSVGRLNGDLFTRTVLGTFLFPGDSVHKKVEVLSGGEKSRLQLAKLLLDPPNVLLLDEPTTHLDLTSVEALVDALKSFEGTICAISHDVYFLNAVADHVVHVVQGKITVYPGNFEYFQHRMAQLEAENGGPAKAAPTDARPESAADNAYEASKDARRKAKALEKAQAELERLHADMERIANEMSDPKLYEDFDRVTKVGEEMETVQAALQAKEEEVKRLTA
ncbi:MAG: ABC-F family ATP-binding cassette domain-containing protein [Elusimicrobiota bacterium]|nr:MAG: ABC-F family ATP-binding cassette domain-containing protein [Elusimicrobiota bacterium]